MNRRPRKGAAAPPAPELRDVPLDAVTWEKQPREAFEDGPLEDLAASMKRDGPINPPTVRKTADGYVGVCGERRFRAAKKNGWKTILALVTTHELSEEEILARQLAENEYREGLQPVERATAYRRLMTLRGWTAKRLAAHLGVSGAKICQELKLLDLPEEVQRDVDAGRVPASTASEITKAAPEDREELCRQVREDGATRQQIQDQVRKSRDKKAPVKPSPTVGDFRFSIPAEDRPYGFEVTGNKIVVTGKKINSVDALAEAAKFLHASVEASRRLAEKKRAERHKKQPPAAPPVALSPPTGTVPAGDVPFEPFQEVKS